MKSRIVLLGPPASGKGTQAELIQGRYGIPVASPGAILREEKRRGSELGIKADLLTQRGCLVPDLIVVNLVKQWLGRSGGIFIFDGFPRTLGQATLIESYLTEKVMPLDMVIAFEVSLEALQERVANRLVCSQCATSFRLGFHIHSNEDRCPRCAGGLVRRSDDTVEVLSQRMIEYRLKTEPLIGFYKQRGILRMLDASGRPEKVFESIVNLLEA